MNELPQHPFNTDVTGKPVACMYHVHLKCMQMLFIEKQGVVNWTTSPYSRDPPPFFLMCELALACGYGKIQWTASIHVQCTVWCISPILSDVWTAALVSACGYSMQIQWGASIHVHSMMVNWTTLLYTVEPPLSLLPDVKPEPVGCMQIEWTASIMVNWTYCTRPFLRCEHAE